MNSRSEFNRCALPRLGLQLGDNDYKKQREAEMEEREKEREMEREIEDMRKQSNTTKGRMKKICIMNQQ